MPVQQCYITAAKAPISTIAFTATTTAAAAITSTTCTNYTKDI